jgi:AcrR family transcriptional regulator
LLPLICDHDERYREDADSVSPEKAPAVVNTAAASVTAGFDRSGDDGTASLRIDARLNRTSILRAVRDVVSEKGKDASIREIADAAGVATATIYRHFDGKSALFDGVSLLRWSHMLRAAGDGNGNGSEGIRRAVRIIDAYTKMTTADSRFIKALGLHVGHEPAGIGPIREAFDPAFALIWRAGQQKGEIRRGADPNDAIEMAGAVRESGRRLQMLTLVVAGIATPEIEPEQLIREMYVRK